MVEMPPLDDDGDGFWWHGRCFIAAKGVDALLMLPIAQLDGLQLSDIGRKAMTAILDRKEWN